MCVYDDVTCAVHVKIKRVAVLLCVTSSLLLCVTSSSCCDKESCFVRAQILRLDENTETVVKTREREERQKRQERERKREREERERETPS